MMIGNISIYQVFQIAYPIGLGLFNFCVVIGIWLWFKHPIYIYKIIQWYNIRRSGLSTKLVTIDKTTFRVAYRGLPDPTRSSLLFIHGFTGGLTDWLKVIEHIPKDSEHLVLIDLPGHGKSEYPEDMEPGLIGFAKTIKKVLDSSGFEKTHFHVVGQSMGGSIGALFAQLYSNQVDLVSFIAPYGYCDIKNEFYTRCMNGDYSWLLPATMEQFNVFARKMTYKTIQLSGQMMYAYMFERLTYHEIYLHILQSIANEENYRKVYSIAPEIQQPSSVIWGVQDEICPVGNATILKSLLSECRRMDVIEECGHSVNWEMPELIVKYLMLFRKDAELKKFN